MELTFAPKGILQIDDASICYRNFEGRGDDFNREGDRNFSLIIPTEEMRDELEAEGWRIKTRPPREEGDTPFMTLPVKVKFNGRGPAVYLQAGSAPVRELDEESVGILDRIDILSVNLDIRPYDWELKSGKTGRSAYLQSIHVIQSTNRFAERFSNKEV